MAIHNEVGAQGEQIAASYLTHKGYVVHHQSYRIGKLEIDLICEDGEELIFVEVKTRTSKSWGSPFEAVTENKIRNLIQAADVYLSGFSVDLPLRFDLIGIVLHPRGTEVEHIIDAFNPAEYLF